MLGGADEPDDESSRRNANAVWNVARGVLPMYGGDQLVSMIQGITRGRRPEIGNGAAGETVNAALAAVYDLAKAISTVATSDRNSPDQAAGYERLRKAVGSVVLSGTDVAGLPVSPLARIGGKVYNSATRVPEDPRKVESRRQTAQAKEWRGELSGEVQSMLAEKNRLDAIGEQRLTDSERDRQRQLQRIEKWYRKMMEYRGAGRDDEARAMKERIEAEALGELN